MDISFILAWVMRWLHVVAAVVAVGSTILMRFAVLPALANLPNGEQVLDAIRAPYKKIIHSAIGLLLLTGLYNYIIVAIPKVRALRALPQYEAAIANYHSIMGGKIILSLALFAIATMLLAPVPSMHAQRKKWLTVNTVLGLLILLLAAYLRRIWPVPTG
jgi:hypothetical protein